MQPDMRAILLTAAIASSTACCTPPPRLRVAIDGLPDAWAELNAKFNPEMTSDQAPDLHDDKLASGAGGM